MNRATGMLFGLILLLCGLGQARADMFHYTGGIQTYTVPTTGLYTITAAGAQGGSGSDSNSIGGRGTVLGGDISLTAGTVLQIVVGGQGLTGNFENLFGGGGGGGSFVFVSGPPSQPLLVAGGGGGAAYEGFDDITNGGSGQTGTAGQSGFGTFGGTGGTLGSGGGGGTNAFGENGGGGAGWLGNGGNGVGTGPNFGDEGSGDGGFGPLTFAGGLGDGTQARPGGQYADGGYGGGGGGGYQGGGGGGGYSGGGGGDGGTANFDNEGGAGGGGGSYFSSNLNLAFDTGGINSGDGYVDIVPATAAPEPSSLLLLGLGGISFATYGWRRRKQPVTV